jgi:hypothetical protein
MRPEWRPKIEGMSGAETLEEYTRENWPWGRYGSWEDARGWVTRMRAETSSREGRSIAKEIGTSWSTFKRIIRWYLLSIDDYHPDEWRSAVLTANAESRARMRQRHEERDRRVKRENELLRTERDALAHQRLVQQWMEQDANAPPARISQPRDPATRGRASNKTDAAKARAQSMSTGGNSDARGGGAAARSPALSAREKAARAHARRLREMLGPNPPELGS